MKLLRLTECGIEKAVEELLRALALPGGVVLVPTETVYGLVCRSADDAAREKIFQLKNRPSSKRLGFFIGDWRRLGEYGVLLEGLPEKLASRYTPGAITIIAPCRNGETLGFRVPDHPLLQALLARSGELLCQTSANASGTPDALTAPDALKMLAGEVDCAVDGGPLPPDAKGSTVVDATGNEIRILRQGSLFLQ